MVNRGLAIFVVVGGLLFIAGLVILITDQLAIFGRGNGTTPIIAGVIVFIVGLICCLTLLSRKVNKH